MSAWSESDREIFVAAVLAEARRLGHAEAGFKKTSWTRICSTTNERASREFNKRQLQSQLQHLKKKYITFSSMKSNSGFGWCAVTGRPTAPDDVWAAYLLHHPKAREFQDRTLPMYEELHEIFSGATATGHYATASGVGSPRDAAEDSDQCSSNEDAASGVCDNAASPIHSNTLPISKPPGDSITPQKNLGKQRSKRQRTNGERISGALEKIDKTHHERTMSKNDKKTPTQVAIKEFLLDFGPFMDANERVKYVHYFMNHTAAAEAFVVLDIETKRAFLSTLLD